MTEPMSGTVHDDQALAGVTERLEFVCDGVRRAGLQAGTSSAVFADMVITAIHTLAAELVDLRREIESMRQAESEM